MFFCSQSISCVKIFCVLYMHIYIWFLKMLSLPTMSIHYGRMLPHYLLMDWISLRAGGIMYSKAGYYLKWQSIFSIFREICYGRMHPVWAFIEMTQIRSVLRWLLVLASTAWVVPAIARPPYHTDYEKMQFIALYISLSLTAVGKQHQESLHHNW